MTTTHKFPFQSVFFFDRHGRINGLDAMDNIFDAKRRAEEQTDRDGNL